MTQTPRKGSGPAQHKHKNGKIVSAQRVPRFSVGQGITQDAQGSAQQRQGTVRARSRLLSLALQKPAGYSAAQLIHLHLISLKHGAVSVEITGISGKFEVTIF